MNTKPLSLESYVKQCAERAKQLRGDIVFQDNDIVSRVDAPNVRCRITGVKHGGAVFEVIKKDGTPDKRWRCWSGSLDVYVLVSRET